MNTKNVPQPKNPFNSAQLKERINRSIADRKKIVFYLLLCPCYPHDGSKFTYDSQSTGLSSDAPPNLDRFVKKLRNNIEYLKFYGVPEDAIQVRSLVCDIEYDLPTVLEKFAGGNKDMFLKIISQTAVNIGKIIQNEFSDHSKIDISSKTFLEGLEDLPKYQEHYTAYVQKNKLPDEFDGIRKKASDRTDMFEKLYGATTPEDKNKISLRQMINYFSVMRSIQEQSPGAIVINDKTPNVEFFNHPAICKILDTDENTFPIFQILNYMKHVILCYADTIKLNPDISLFECYTLTGQRTDAFQLSQKGFERIRNASFFSNQNMYFASKNLPCKQTATTLCSQAIPLGALNQVLHNFEDFSNKDDWNGEELPPEKQVLLREKSLQLFFENRLGETQENVALRFQEIEHIAQTSMRPCIFIAPGFVVTLFKIYKKTNHFQNTNPETIKKLACLHEPFGKPLEGWSWEE